MLGVLRIDRMMFGRLYQSHLVREQTRSRWIDEGQAVGHEGWVGEGQTTVARRSGSNVAAHLSALAHITGGDVGHHPRYV